MKRFLYGMLTASLVFTSALTLQAKTESVNIPVKYNNIKVTVDGKELTTSNEPFIYNGVTYLPVRDVAEATGKAVNWDANTKTVALTSQGTTTEPTQTPDSSTTSEPVQTPDDTQKENSSFSIDTHSVNIRDDFYLTVDKPLTSSSETDLIAIKFDYTNKKDSKDFFYISNNIKVYQDGVELDPVNVSSSSPNYALTEKYTKGMETGTHLIGKLYKLNNKTSDVTVEVSPYSNSSIKITKTFKIAE